MKKQSGFISIIAIVVAVLVVAGIGYVYYQAGQKGKTVATQDSVSSKSADNAVIDPYAGWKTYTSSYAKPSFRYPADWSVITYTDFDAPEDAPAADAIQLLAPSGFKVSWVAHLGGLGGACDDQAPLGSDGACPLLKVVDRSQLSGHAGTLIVSGLTTSDSVSFTPWMVMQEGKYAVISDIRSLGILAWMSDSSEFARFFGTATAVSGRVESSKGSETQAKAFFDTTEAKQAKLILQSTSY